MRNISAGTMGLLLIAVIAGLIGAYTVRSLLTTRQQPPPEAAAAPAAPIRVPLASADLPVGRVLALDDIALTPMSGPKVGELGVPLDVLMLSAEQIIGRRLREPIERGRPFLTTSLYLVGGGPRVDEMLQNGMRAFSLSLPALNVAGVESGTHVDVLFRAEARPGRGDALAIPETTLMIVEDVEVLQVERANEQAVSPPRDSAILTLAVKPGQANVLQAVQGRGEITLVARAVDEVSVEEANRSGVTLEDLLGVEPPPPVIPPPPAEPPFETEIFRRGLRRVNMFRGNWRVDSVSDEPDPPPTDPAEIPTTPAPIDEPDSEADVDPSARRRTDLRRPANAGRNLSSHAYARRLGH